MTFSYYPGCTLSTTAKALDDCARRSALALGFALEEISNWQCCGAVFPLNQDEIAHKLGAVRALRQASKCQQPLVTLCAACHHVLKQVNQQVRKDAEMRKTIAQYDPDCEYAGETEVLHYVEVLKRYIGFDTLKQAVKRPLEGRKIGAYYGCQILRPAELMEFDDPENPGIFEDFLRALGAEPVRFSYRNECCGGYRPGFSGGSKVVDSALLKGADALITACPLCEYNVSKMAGEKLPIYYFTALLAEALDLPEEKCEKSKKGTRATNFH